MELETLTFPAAEAAEPATFAYRIAHFGEWFLVAEEEGRIVGFINARPTADPAITDALYEANMLPAGKSLAILCLETDPASQRRGVAGMLLREIIERARGVGMQALVLACKDRLIPYYATFGFAVAGVSASAHGGARWNDMTLNH
jgi:GNAT superfamily N-acetyltransferase